MVIVKAVAVLLLLPAFLLGYAWAGWNSRQRTRHHEKQTNGRRSRHVT
jgi:hypothetical protein